MLLAALGQKNGASPFTVTLYLIFIIYYLLSIICYLLSNNNNPNLCISQYIEIKAINSLENQL